MHRCSKYWMSSCLGFSPPKYQCYDIRTRRIRRSNKDEELDNFRMMISLLWLILNRNMYLTWTGLIGLIPLHQLHWKEMKINILQSYLQIRLCLTIWIGKNLAKNWSYLPFKSQIWRPIFVCGMHCTGKAVTLILFKTFCIVMLQ